MPKQTPQKIFAMKKQEQKITCLTAYTDYMARLMDDTVDLILVGDSLGMVVYGMETTLAVTVDMMCVHGRAVANAAQNACVVVDMPFASYQESPQQAYRNAARIMAETGCDAVKLEGGEDMASTISFLTSRGIPVMAHIGLTPQSVNALGGFKVQGKTDASANRILKDARAVEAAGAFSVVIECVMESLAAQLSKELAIPTIGIGASVKCDGQILVTEDMLGVTPNNPPKFVKRFAEIGTQMKSGLQQYAQEVQEGTFPSEEFTYTLPTPKKKSA